MFDLIFFKLLLRNVCVLFSWEAIGFHLLRVVFFVISCCCNYSLTFFNWFNRNFRRFYSSLWFSELILRFLSLVQAVVVWKILKVEHFSKFEVWREKKLGERQGKCKLYCVQRIYGSSKTRIKRFPNTKMIHVSKVEEANENVFLFCFVLKRCTHDHWTSVYTEFVSFIYFSFISFGVGLFLYENQENKKKTEISINIQNHLIFSKKIKNILLFKF